MIATAITAGVALVGQGIQMSEKRKMEKKANKAIDNFQWNDLTNPYESQQVSTLGSDLLTEQADINAATATEALRSSGTRGLAAGLGKIEAYRNNVNREIAANLDEQQKAIDRAVAAQEDKNQQDLAKRQEAELQGYGAMLNAARSEKQDAYDGMINNLNLLSSNLTQSGLFNNTPQVKPMGNSLSPAGFATYTPPVPTSSFTFNK